MVVSLVSLKVAASADNGCSCDMVKCVVNQRHMGVEIAAYVGAIAYSQMDNFQKEPMESIG
jgi:hypothetical protein